MKKFLIIFISIVLLIRCTSKNNLVVQPVIQTCDTCSHHTDTSKSKTDTTTIALDTIPASIVIYGDSSIFEKISSPSPVSLTVAIKNKEGNFIKGVPVVFSAGLNSGSLNHDTTNTDMWGTANAVWTLNPQADTSQQVIAKVVYKNTNLSVSFHAMLTHDTLYNYIGTLTMDSTSMPGSAFIGFFGDSTNAPDPFTISSDSLALSNGIPYPFELDGIIVPTLQPGEHGVGGYASMVINQIPYGNIHVNYEVSNFNIMEATYTRTFTNPEPCTVTMYWQIRGEGNSYEAYLAETVSSPTKGTFTNGRTGKIAITSVQTIVQ
jgi:Macroglobulin domain MG4